MPKQAKLIIVILAILLVMSVGLGMTLYSQKGELEKTRQTLQEQLAKLEASEKKLTEEKNTLLKEKDKLGEDIKKAERTKSGLDEKVNALNTQVTSLSKERDDWKNRVESVRRERDELLGKLQEAQAAQEKLQEELAAKAKVAPAVDASLAGGASAQVVEPGVGPAAGTLEGEAVSSPEVAQQRVDEEYWAQILKEKAALELELNQLKSDLSSSAVEIEEHKKKIAELELELSLFVRQKEDIERKIKYNEDLASSLSTQLAREKNDKRMISGQLEKLTQENLDLRSQIKELATVKVSLEKGIAKLTEQKDSVSRKLSETEGILQSRIGEVLDIKESLDNRMGQKGSADLSRAAKEAKISASQEVELPPIVVSAPNGNKAAKAQRRDPAQGFNGRVVSVNEDNNFVIVDIGQSKGIQVGDTLTVYRGEKYIANIEVIQVRQEISAADIKEKGARIKAGDIVR